MSIFDEDIITKNPYDDYRLTSILFVKLQFIHFIYDYDFGPMLWNGELQKFCQIVDEHINSIINREYNTSHGVKEEHISIRPIVNIGYCKYFQINSHITTLNKYTFKLYSMCFCIQPDKYGRTYDSLKIVWEDEVKDSTVKEQFEKIKMKHSEREEQNSHEYI